MTDTTYLKSKIDCSGLKQVYIYETLGLTKSCWYNRLKGKTPFKAEEITELAKILKLSNRDVMHIFFPKM